MADIVLRFQPYAVLPDYVHKEVELCWFCCAIIEDKAQAQSIILKLAQIYPLNDFCHLKRARMYNKKLQVLIKPLQGCDDDLSVIQRNLEEHSITSISPLFMQEVPQFKPVTRKQFTQSNSYWNCSFHEDKTLEKALDNDYFSKEELDRIDQYMKIALEEQSRAMETRTHSVPVAGAVAVSMETGEIIARGHTDTTHPLKHAVMECIDKVAVTQGGGARSAPSLLQTLDNNPRPGGAGCRDLDSTKKPKLESYLCSGYAIFTTVEPCVMCSMALVHSRVKQVFYDKCDPSGGGLGSKYKIHCSSLLNHHFQVFRNEATLSTKQSVHN